LVAAHLVLLIEEAVEVLVVLEQFNLYLYVVAQQFQ
jgi:hypothetical protein